MRIEGFPLAGAASHPKDDEGFGGFAVQFGFIRSCKPFGKWCEPADAGKTECGLDGRAAGKMSCGTTMKKVIGHGCLILPAPPINGSRRTRYCLRESNTSLPAYPRVCGPLLISTA